MTREVERLTRLLERHRAIREQYRFETKNKESRDKEINEAPKVIKNMDFWCDHCSKDFSGNGYKRVQADPTLAGFRIAFYQGRCPKEHWTIRRITDKPLDPYFIKSLNIRRQRVDQKKDILQPNDYGFKMLYGDPNL